MEQNAYHISERQLDFMKETNILMAIGYKRGVNWTESTVVDFLLFNFIQHYKDMRKFWNRFRRAYSGLVRATGLEAFHRDGASPR